MSIDDYWEDGYLYYVEFISVDDRSIQKELVFPMNMKEDSILEIIKMSFLKVKEVRHLDCISEILIVKDRKYGND